MFGNKNLRIVGGLAPNNQYREINSDAFGHLEVAIHGPLLPFGSVHSEGLRPVLQFDGVHKLNPLLHNTIESLGGTAETEDSAMKCETSTGLYGNATIQSIKRLKYKSGQGSVMRFTAQFTDNNPNDASTYQIVGFGHPEDGYYVGYVGPQFGILHVNRAFREIQTLTLTSGSSSAGNTTIELNGVSFSVPVSNNSGDISKTAYEISIYDYSTWRANVIGETVIFIAGSSGLKNGSYSSSFGSFAQTRAGSSGTETFIPQSSFNQDKLDGSGPSGVTIDPTKFNVFQIGLQYLGTGSVMFSVIVDNSTNNNTWTPFHSIRNPNNLIATHIADPSLPFTMSAYKLAPSSQNFIVKSASVMGAVEGFKFRHGPRLSFLNTINIDTTLKAAFILCNSNTYTDKANQTVVLLRSLICATESSNNAITQCSIIRNPVIDVSSGDITFREVATDKSCLLIHDSNALDVSSYDEENVIYSIVISESGQAYADFNNYDEDIDLQPNECIAVCLKVNSGSATVSTSLNVREDQ